jgi:hypothetical protein
MIRTNFEQLSKDYVAGSSSDARPYALLRRSARVNASNSVNHRDGLKARDRLSPAPQWFRLVEAEPLLMLG